MMRHVTWNYFSNFAADLEDNTVSRLVPGNALGVAFKYRIFIDHKRKLRTHLAMHVL
jgi:hypothetical protein